MGTFCRPLEFSLNAVSFCPVLWPANSSHLGVPELPPLFPQLGEIAGLCLSCCPLYYGLETLSKWWAGQWSYDSLYFFFRHSEITVFCCQMSHDLKIIVLYILFSFLVERIDPVPVTPSWLETKFPLLETEIEKVYTIHNGIKNIKTSGKSLIQCV